MSAVVQVGFQYDDQNNNCSFGMTCLAPKKKGETKERKSYDKMAYTATMAYKQK